MSSRKQTERPKKRARVVFLFDVDNTLLDNDRVVEDLRTYLRQEVGAKKCQSLLEIFERRRTEVGYAITGSTAGLSD